MAEDDNEEEFSGLLLHQAALWGNAELLEDLLHGEQLQYLNAVDSLGRTALHAAATNANETCTRILLQAGANPNIVAGSKGHNKTPLHVAAENGHLSTVELLTEFQANLLAKDINGLTALDLAEKSDHPQVMETLRKAADEQEQKRQELYLALWDSCSKGEISQTKQIIRELGREAELVINSAPNGCSTLLFKACEEGQKDMVKFLLEKGADGRIHPVTKYSPLYIACYYGRKDIVEILLKKFPELVRVPTVEKWLPIHAAAINGHVHVLDLLLNFSYPPSIMQSYIDKTGNWEYYFPYDINAKDVTGQTVLYVGCYVGNQRLVDTLLKFKIKAQRHNHSKENIEERTEQKESLEINSKRSLSDGLHNVMVKLKLKSNSVLQESRTESEIRPIDLDVYCNNNTETCLHVAVRNKHYNIVSMLLQCGANPNLCVKQPDDYSTKTQEDFTFPGSSALMEACKNHDGTMVDSLIRYGARDDDCKALKIACSYNDEHIVSRLLSLKAYQDPEFKINKKALEISPSTQLSGFMNSVTYSSMFPTTPVMINWHGQKCLNRIQEQWLINACVTHNIKLKLTPRNQSTALIAITRLDISNNQLTELPLCIFQMPSLKILNAAQNKIFKLPESIDFSHSNTNLVKSKHSTLPLPSQWHCPVLEEIHLQENRLDNVPSCLFDLPSLILLDLSNNKLQSLPFKMWSAPKLRELNLSLNMLHDLPCRSVSSGINLLDPRQICNITEDQTASAESSPRHTSDAISLDSSVSGSEGRCISPSIGTSPQSTAQGTCYGNLQQQDLHHDNLWSHSIEIIEASLNDDLEKEQCCQLTSLNLSHNAYKTIPPVLACFAINLSRLNMSYNRLVDMGSVTCYPAGLKHLDLSHNHIVSWPTQNRTDPEPVGDSSGVLCYNYLETNSPQRSKSSPAAKKPSSSLHSWGSMKSLFGSPCAHRRHIKLDNLRTFILADNQLDRLVLTIEEDIGDEDENKFQEVDTISTASRESCSTRSKLLYPALSMLDISNNYIKEVPSSISELTNLSVLNISGNTDICYLPAEMGLLTKLWNLNTRCCNLNEPLKSMIDSKKYKTMDVIGYLKSILEDAKPYARMKLMIVGVEGIGKTSLLDQLRQEGTGTYRKKPPEHWAKRMGNKNINQKTSKGISISTVGVDVGDWVYEKKVRGQSSYGPVIFRTWDFGGQKEYYATHQYFLSKRSIYLVVWRITDGERGANTILQWLVNIQARAPNAPVLIVGTHYDLVKERCPPSYSEELQQLIREKFINVVDADKYGLPRVLDTIEVSCKTRHNIKLLCNLIYDTVFDLKCPGSKERLLEQRIPATYLALEDVVGNLSVERHLQGKDPVLRAEQYKMLVMHEMQQRYNIAFRDMAELNQATAFLHENGVLLHYEDATLKDLYFLDPQWLCDMLAHVVTIREINPFARNGIMKIEDLKHVFKSSQCAPTDAQNYILYLLNKFEVALTWDNRTLLIPSLLPTEEQLRAGFPGCEVRIPLRSRSWALRKNFSSTISSNTSFNLVLKSKEKRPQKLPLEAVYLTNNISKPEIQDQDSSCLMSPTCFISHLTQHENIIRRLLIMSYFPSGFWSRLMTRMLADDLIVEVIRSYFILPKDLQMDPLLASILNQRAEWICWQTGMELRYLDSTLFRMKEILPYLNNSPCDYRQMRFLLQQEGIWNDVDINNSSILEILLPNQTVVIQKPVIGDITENQTAKQQVIELKPSKECVAKLLSLAVDHVDTLLEDWYPTLGTRFVHTSEGKFLVTRLVPCTHCLASHLKEELMGGGYSGESFSVFDHHWDKESWQMVDVTSRAGGEPSITKSCLVSGNNLWTSGLQSNQIDCNSPNIFRRNQGSRSSTVSHDSDSGVGPDSNSSSRKPSAEGRTDDIINNDQDPSQLCVAGIPCDVIVYNFMVEDCILVATQQECLQCPSHGELSLTQIAPDIVFVDLGERFLIQPDSIRRGKMLGRGAFGFVFKASVKQRGSNSCANVAMKMLQPVDPGFGARQSDTVAYKAAWNKWQRDPLQYACKAYCTARQELNILMSLRHTNIVPLVGVCTHPLALVLQLAPQGALDSVLRNYRRSGARLDLYVLQKVIIQIAKALEYLHQQHIIYRDLKSENVLVWDFPPPFHAVYPHPVVEIKLADYGISRSTLPTGTKGFGGTEGFMAPEIMRYNGEEEYTEKVDCFSFGMFMYELITLHLPFEGHECAKDHILDGGRPSLTYREMLYPTYVLDLMTLCWSQQPKDRPSASQIVSIATAPEFTHLVDIVSLNDRMAVLSAGATEVTSENGETITKEIKWEVWLSRLGKQLDILSSTEHGWRDYKALTLETVTVTALCLVNDTIWLGDSRGKIHIYSITSHNKLSSFSLETLGISSSAIRSMCYLKEQKYIAMATSDGRLWLCNIKNSDQFEEQTEDKTELENVTDFVQELGSKDCPVFCIAAVSLTDHSCELWCGQTQGSMKIFALHNAVVVSHEVVYHYEPIIDNLDVTQLVSSKQKQPMIWSYVYPGCVAYHWDTVNRIILHKLDCSKLAPCSESLMSISIEEHLSPGRCQVTAMAILDLELYIGTTWGCIIVVESITMRPITIFRPFEEEVKAILPLGTKSSHIESPITQDVSLSFIAAVGKGYRNLIGRYTALPHFNIHIHDNMYLLLIRTDNWSSS